MQYLMQIDTHLHFGFLLGQGESLGTGLTPTEEPSEPQASSTYIYLISLSPKYRAFLYKAVHVGLHVLHTKQVHSQMYSNLSSGRETSGIGLGQY